VFDAVGKVYPSRCGGVTSLTAISFDVAKSKRFAVISPSGAGKTTQSQANVLTS